MRTGRFGVVVVLAVLAGLLGPAPTRAERPPDTGRVFDVKLHEDSKLLYGAPGSGPDAATYGAISLDPGADASNHFQTYVEGVDGTRIFVEAWLPRPKDGNVPPTRLPTVVDLSAYAYRGYAYRTFREHFVPRGYAYVQVHLRGSGSSEGCLDRHGPLDASDGAAALEWIVDQPWSNGKLALFGSSYDAGAAINVAARGGPITERIKAIAVHAPELAVYDSHWYLDGVRSADIVPIGSNSAYTVNSHAYFPFLFPPPTPVDDWGSHVVDRVATASSRVECRDAYRQHIEAAADASGDVTPYYMQRDARKDAVANIKAPILVSHGHADLNPAFGMPPITQAGFFDRLPVSLPKVGLFGVFGHESQGDTALIGRRPDYFTMRIAWFDHWVRGLDSGVDEWPTVQVQGSDGQWRAEPNWPTTGSPVGHLALGSNGSLGTPSPVGSTALTENPLPLPVVTARPDRVVFQTAPLPDRLELTGQPVLDLWVRLDDGDAHLAAVIEVLDSRGDSKPQEARRINFTYGMRSLRHLQPLVDNRFAQREGVDAPVGTAIRVPIRFQPTDLVFEKGEALRVTVGDSLLVNPGAEMFLSQAYRSQTRPVLDAISDPACCWSGESGSRTTIEILHNCSYPSSLRFLMPRRSSDLLNVRDNEPPGQPVEATDAPPRSADGGGLATAPVCGTAPSRILDVTPTLGEPYRPELALTATPDAVTGADSVNIVAVARSFFGKDDIADATVELRDGNRRLLRQWRVDEFRATKEGVELAVDSGRLTGVAPWSVKLTATNAESETAETVTFIQRT